LDNSVIATTTSPQLAKIKIVQLCTREGKTKTLSRYWFRNNGGEFNICFAVGSLEKSVAKNVKDL